MINDMHIVYDESEIEKMRQSNLDKLQALANQGIGLSVGDLSFIKMEALIEILIPEESYQRNHLDYLIEKKKKEVIDQVMAEIRKAQIVQGVNQAKSKLHLK